MKLYDLSIVVLIALAGVYMNSVANRVEEQTVEAAKAVVKADIAKFKPSDKLIINE